MRRRYATSRSPRRWITTGRWLSRDTEARSSSNSLVLPTRRASVVCRSSSSVWARVVSAISTRRSASTASKYAWVTSSASCARCVVSPTSAERRPAVAAAFCPLLRPPLNTLCENASPSEYWFFAPKLDLLKSIPCAAAQVCACASAASRCAGVAFAGMFGAQTACGFGTVEVSGAPARAENCERSVRAYATLPLSCGMERLCACCCWPLARMMPARATWSSSLSRAASRIASSSESGRAEGILVAAAGAGCCAPSGEENPRSTSAAARPSARRAVIRVDAAFIAGREWERMRRGLALPHPERSRR